METKIVITIITIIVSGIISFFFASIHQSEVRFKKTIKEAKEIYYDVFIIIIGAAILKATCYVLWLCIIIVIMIELNISTSTIILHLLSTGSGAYLGYVVTNWWFNRKMQQYKKLQEA